MGGALLVTPRSAGLAEVAVQDLAQDDTGRDTGPPGQSLKLTEMAALKGKGAHHPILEGGGPSARMLPPCHRRRPYATTASL